MTQNDDIFVITKIDGFVTSMLFALNNAEVFEIEGNKFIKICHRL